jgi:hypothetical protein
VFAVIWAGVGVACCWWWWENGKRRNAAEAEAVQPVPKDDAGRWVGQGG